MNLNDLSGTFRIYKRQYFKLNANVTLYVENVWSSHSVLMIKITFSTLDKRMNDIAVYESTIC